MYTVFLVDDEVVIREAIRSSFPWERTGFILAGEAPDGEVALSIMQELKPDILLTDIRMPFMDGLALCRKVTLSMPWTHIAILSGFDDFTYAREAMSLGVCEYLLKPVSSLELEAALQRIAGRIDAERRRRADLELIKKTLDLTSGLRKEKLLQDILHGIDEARERARLLQRAKELETDVVARHYRVMLISPGQDPRGSLLPLRAQVQHLADTQGGNVHLCQDNGMLALLFQDHSREELEERIFSFAQAVKHEAETHVCGPVHIAIGVFVSSIFDVPDSRASAATLLKAMGDHLDRDSTRIMDSSELHLEMDEMLSRTAEKPLIEKLRYASLSEVQPILERYFSSGGSAAPPSFMMLNYLYVESLLTAARVIRESGGDPVGIIPEAPSDKNGVTPFSSRKALALAAEKAVRTALDFRDRQALSRYAGLIRNACAFIEGNFDNPDLTLREAARAVHLSANHFSTVFAQETGITFIGYLTSLRMKRARELLRTTAKRSSEIAAAVGYGDPHYFGYLFKKHMGVSPREYRSSFLADEPNSDYTKS